MGLPRLAHCGISKLSSQTVKPLDPKVPIRVSRDFTLFRLTSRPLSQAPIPHSRLINCTKKPFRILSPSRDSQRPPELYILVLFRDRGVQQENGITVEGKLQRQHEERLTEDNIHKGNASSTALDALLPPSANLHSYPERLPPFPKTHVFMVRPPNDQR